MKRIYFVGIKGVGMTGLAVIAKQQGWEVEGSDTAEEFITNKVLRQHDIPVESGFNRAIPQGTDLVVYTAAHKGRQNFQVRLAQKQGIKLLSYGQALAELTKTKRLIAVSGTHGKTTTTAMLAKILKDAGKDPGYLIGTGEIKDLPDPAHWGKGEYFVAEADEYVADSSDPNSPAKFLYLNPFAVIILSTEYDHPDVFKSPKHYYNAYKKLIKKTSAQGLAVVRGDEPFSARLIKSGKSKTKVKPFYFNRPFAGLKLRLLGQYNLANATAAAYLARGLGIDTKLIKKSLNGFQGLERRLELRYTDGVKIYDDYSHHPTEIRRVLGTLRSQYSNDRIIVIFQSHTISRTKKLLTDFGKSFESADKAIIAPIFLSAREKRSNFTGKDLADEISRHHPDVEYLESFSKIIEKIDRVKRKGDVVVVMGAGNIYQIIPDLIDRLQVLNSK
jgi:UDP-N-acetylmuramate--alanine ligase